MLRERLLWSAGHSFLIVLGVIAELGFCYVGLWAVQCVQLCYFLLLTFNSRLQMLVALEQRNVNLVCVLLIPLMIRRPALVLRYVSQPILSLRK